jgi:hypothetical protein
METHFDFDLVVSATQDFNGAVGPPLTQIAGTIHFRSIIVRQNKFVSHFAGLLGDLSEQIPDGENARNEHSLKKTHPSLVNGSGM